MTNELKSEIIQKIEINLNYSSKLLEIVGGILERMHNPTKGELIKAIDEELIYYDDQWEIIKNYISPKEIGAISYYEVESYFFNDILYYIENLGE